MPPSDPSSGDEETELGAGMTASVPTPVALHLGPIDSPRFATPPFAPSHALPALDFAGGSAGDGAPGPEADRSEGGEEDPDDSFDELPMDDLPTEDIGNQNMPSDGDPDGDGALSDLPELDALEQQIDADQIDEFASRMASNRSLSVGSNDRVVEMLLRRGEVDEEHVWKAQKKRDEKHPDAALWRVLAQHEAVDAEVVYGRAARIYAFDVVDLDEHSPDLEFIKSTVESFS